MKFSDRIRGYNIFEVMVVLALISIVMALTWPSWRDHLAKTQSDVLQTQLIQALDTARYQALLKQTPIVIAKTNPNSWLEGVVIYTDKFRDNVLYDQNQIVQTMRFQKTMGQLRWRAFPRNRDIIVYQSDGTTLSENGSFWFCYPDSKKPGWAILLSKSGRTRILSSLEIKNDYYCN